MLIEENQGWRIINAPDPSERGTWAAIRTGRKEAVCNLNAGHSSKLPAASNGDSANTKTKTGDFIVHEVLFKKFYCLICE